MIYKLKVNFKYYSMLITLKNLDNILGFPIFSYSCLQLESLKILAASSLNRDKVNFQGLIRDWHWRGSLRGWGDGEKILKL